jgi:HK97 family phage prohead protease
MQPEFRTAALVDPELHGMNFRGYAAVFDTPWDDTLTEKAGYVERVAQGAFAKALTRGFNVPFLWQHDRKDVLATTQSGTLKLQEDSKGLLVEARLPDTTLGRDVREMIARRDVRGMSYGIESHPRDSVITRHGGVIHRTIASVRRLLDVTLTWEPAYPATTAELRSLGFSAIPLTELAEPGTTAAYELRLQALEDRCRKTDRMLDRPTVRRIPPMGEHAYGPGATPWEPS